MNEKKNERKRPIILALDIIIAILCGTLTFAGIFAVRSFYEEYRWAYDAESFYYRLDDEDYASMVEMYYSNEAAGIKADEDLQQYYGVAKYFEAASHYHMYEQSGDTQRAQRCFQDMEAAKIQMGQLQFVSDQIAARLQIE